MTHSQHVAQGLRAQAINAQNIVNQVDHAAQLRSLQARRYAEHVEALAKEHVAQRALQVEAAGQTIVHEQLSALQQRADQAYLEAQALLQGKMNRKREVCQRSL